MLYIQKSKQYAYKSKTTPQRTQGYNRERHNTPNRKHCNLVIAKIDNDVDTTEVYTYDESDEETNSVELLDIVEDVDEQDYHTDSSSESEEDTYLTPPGYIPPTPPDHGEMRE